MARVASRKRPAAKKIPRLTKPALLRNGHNIADFDCGQDSLNYWLQKHALPAIAARTATTVVVCRGRRVVGYFSLANGAVAHAAASAKVRRNTPDPIPATVLARLAIDKSEQEKGLGTDLLCEALKRALAATKYTASRMIIVHPLNSGAAGFYRNYGFIPLKGETTALYLPMDSVVDSL